MTQAGSFVWYELMTTDVPAAEAFYGKVAGWRCADSGLPGMTYTLLHVGQTRVGGMMTMPDRVRESGGKPAWFGYVAVPDVDEAAEDVKKDGGAIHRAPDDIPTVGRFAMVSDPQGAVFVLFRGNGEPPEPLAPETPGRFTRHEHHANDWEKAFAFYSGLCGWEIGETFDMGPGGKYQIFNHDGEMLGGMLTDPEAERPFWLYYVGVEDIDAGKTRVTEAGGQVTDGPHPVPGGMWIVHATDPQGARFALVGPRKPA